MDTTLSYLFDHSNDFLCVFDRKGTIVHSNTSIREAFGVTEPNINGKMVGEYLHPADLKRSDELLNALGSGKEIKGYENRIRARNGRYYNIKWSFSFNKEDGFIYAIGANSVSNLKNTDELNITDNIQLTIQSFNEGFFIIDRKWQITSFNPSFQAITGLTTRQLKNINLKELRNLGVTSEVMAEFKTAFKTNASSQVVYFNKCFNRWLRLNIYPHKNELTVLIRDITSIKIQELTLALEKRVLELNASPLSTFPQTVNELLMGIEQIHPDMICSVLEINEAQEKMYFLSGPSLPVEFCESVNGASVGHNCGSCGTSAYHRAQVIVSDIETDPIWADYKEGVLSFGLKACWSTPIMSSSNSSHVLATFAVYYTNQREPKPEELKMIERTVNILRVLIENQRNHDHMKDQNKRLHEIATVSSHDVRRPVASILGLISLFDRDNLENPLNKEIINHLDDVTRELDEVIHNIVEKTIHLKSEGLWLAEVSGKS
jgi:PAS domain S-box-containing protein